MYREPSDELVGKATQAIGQLERTLRNMIADVYRAHVEPGRAPDDWWWSHYVHHGTPNRKGTREIVNELKAKKEQVTKQNLHPLEYATLGNLWFLIHHRNQWFGDVLSDYRMKYVLLAKIDELNDSRREKIFHQKLSAPSFLDIKQTIRLVIDIISIIPPIYHDVSGLGIYKSLIDSISASWGRICQEEETYQYFNFPSLSKTFVGRSEEIQRIQKSIQEHRLVTLHGIGGVGKTHLAICATKEHTAGELTTAFSDGFAFVPLEHIHPYPEEVCQAIAHAIGGTAKEISDERMLITFLKSKRFLLLLDNWETVHTTETGSLLYRILAGTNRLRLLVTSQKIIDLGSTGKLIPLEPMRVEGDLESLDAYHLFLHRARTQTGKDDWEPDDPEALQKILKCTDGLPLLIELVVARIPDRTLSLIAQELETHRSRILRRPIDAPLAGPERHKSVEACFEWTYQLLSPEAQELFPALGVFAGGFMTAAALAIGMVEETQEVLDMLRRTSLVRIDTRTGRYSLLPTVREYALAKAGEDVAYYQELHAEYFKNLAVTHGDKERWEVQTEDLDILEAERRNMLAGMEFVHNAGDHHSVVAYMRGLRHFFEIRGYWHIARERLRWGLDAAQCIDDRMSQVSFLLHLGIVVEKQDGSGGEALYKKALAISEQLGDPGGQAQSWYQLADIEQKQKRLSKAMEFLERSLSFDRGQSKGQKWGQALELHQMGFVAIGIAKEKKDNKDTAGEREYIEKAREFNTRALQIREEIKDEAGIAASLRNFGDIFMREGRRDIAHKYYERSLVLSEQIGNKQGIAASLHRFGRFFQGQDDEKSRDYFIRSLKIKQELGNWQDEAVTLEQLAYVERQVGRKELQRGESEEAAQQFRAAIQYWERWLEIQGNRRSPAVGRIRREIRRTEKELQRLDV